MTQTCKQILLSLALLALAACGGGGGGDTPATGGSASSSGGSSSSGGAPGSSSSSTSSSGGASSSSSGGTAWIEDGRLGVPTSSFTLPASAKNSDGGIYLPDLQASYPAVDWAGIDRLYIPAGNYKYIRLGNLPQRNASKKLVITNSGGQVKVGGQGHYYLFVISGGSNWVLSGRYDPVSQTGHASYPGHRGGAFANSQGKYGILIDDAYSASGISGLSIGGGATRFELEYLEITRVGFAGIVAKTDNTASAVMEACKLHDLYIHDTLSEGMYIGSTQAQPQHQIRDWEIWNNRILRSGTEALQLGQLGGNNHVHHNVIGPAAIDWRSAFQTYQDGNLQVSMREGHLLLEKNLFIGSAGTHFILFTRPIAGDATAGNLGVTARDNYFSDMRNLGLYIDSQSLAGMSFSFQNNVWRNRQFNYTEVYPSATPYDHLLRIMNTSTPIVFSNSDWDSSLKFVGGTSNALPTGNGTSGNVSGTGNDRRSIDAVRFVNAGLADGFDYLRLEYWQAVATLNGNAPITYPLDKIVMHKGLPYRCKLSPCAAGLIPPDNPAAWEALPAFADDVRVLPGSTYDGWGLQPLP